MSAVTRPVVVVVDPAVPAQNAVHWAATEAARRGVELQIVLPDDHTQVPACRDAFARALATARAAAPDVAVAAQPTAETPLRAEQISSTDAAVLVVAGPHRGRRADHDGLLPGGGGPGRQRRQRRRGRRRDQEHPAGGATLVLAAGPSTGPEVLDFAFAEAAARGIGLCAVRTWGIR